ncbi:unnamed protein product, partial [marine sediment metagenome]
HKKGREDTMPYEGSEERRDLQLRPLQGQPSRGL